MKPAFSDRSAGNHGTMRRLMALYVLSLAVGCTASSTSNTQRTAKEQMLLSNAVDQSLNKVDFSPLYGQRVLVEEKYLDCVDKNYIVGSIRHRALRSGATLAASADEADVVIELRSGGVGTDTTEAFIGIPEFTLPGMMTLPEIRLAERKAQYGYAKLGMVMYDAKTRQTLGDGGVAMAQSDDNNWSLLGVGPYQSGSLKGEVGKSRMVPPGSYRRQLPSQVAFTAPSSASTDPAASMRFASEGRPQE